MKKLAVLLLAASALVGVACAPLKTPPGSPSQAVDLFNIENGTRNYFGRAGLSWDQCVANEAQIHAVWMAQNNVQQHGDYTGCGGRYFGQNIWLVPCSYTAAQVNDGFVNSPEHFSNMLDPRFGRAGNGVACNGATGNAGWVENFAG